MTIEALEKSLKEGKLNEIYLFYGEETYLLETNEKKIRTLFGEIVKGINYIEIDDTNLQNLISDLQLKNRGTKTAGYYVIKHNTVPAILIELGFLSGSTDYSRLTNSSFQKKAAKSIYDSIIEMFTTYPTGR